MPVYPFLFFKYAVQHTKHFLLFFRIIYIILLYFCASKYQQVSVKQGERLFFFWLDVNIEKFLLGFYNTLLVTNLLSFLKFLIKCDKIILTHSLTCREQHCMSRFLRHCDAISYWYYIAWTSAMFKNSLLCSNGCCPAGNERICECTISRNMSWWSKLHRLRFLLLSRETIIC